MSRQKPVTLCDSLGVELIKFKSLTECSNVLNIPVQTIAKARMHGHMSRKKWRFK